MSAVEMVPQHSVRDGRSERLHRRLMEEMLTPRDGWEPAEDLLADPSFAALPLILRKARAVKYLLDNMPIHIYDDELIVGNFVAKKHKKAFPNYAKPEEAAAAAERELSIQSVYGHAVPQYSRVLSKGLSGIIADAQQRIAEIQSGKNGVAPMSPTPIAEDVAQGVDFLEAVIIVCQAVIDWAHRYAALAEHMAGDRADARRAAELRRIAAACRWAPEHQPRSFQEALQGFWFVHAALHNTLTHSACGRFDQFVYPYFKMDYEAGRLDLAAAQELVDSLWIKFNERAIIDREIAETKVDGAAIERRMAALRKKGIDPNAGTDPYERLQARDSVDATNHWLQNIILAGQNEKGEDVSNEVTYLCLNSLQKLEVTNPVVSLRLHRDSPPELVRRCAEVIRSGGGMPAIFNDEALIPALQKVGFPLEHARDYTNDGCWEVIVPGRTEFRFTRLGLLRCLEWALNRGRSLLDDEQEAPDTGDPAQFATFDELYAAFWKHVERWITFIVEGRTSNYGAPGMIAPDPLFSATLEGPVERARDVTVGGARYIHQALIGEGISHTADSLAAIRRLVYEEKRLTMADLAKLLRENFAGQEDFRQLLVRYVPKFGNDEEYVDSIYADIVRTFSKTVRKQAAAHPWMTFSQGMGTFSWYIAIGEGLGASADGRVAKAPVASNCSPSAGADLNGPAAAIRSFTKADLTDLATGSPLDLRLPASLFKGEEGLDRLTALLRSFVDMKGNIMTITVSDAATLRAAQREPERYRGLRVRMGGWSAYFIALSKEQQEYHIKAVERGRL